MTIVKQSAKEATLRMRRVSDRKAVLKFAVKAPQWAVPFPGMAAGIIGAGSCDPGSCNLAKAM